MKAGDPDLPEATRAVETGVRLHDMIDRDAQGADVAQVNLDPRPPRADGMADSIDVDLGDPRLRVAERVHVDVRDVAGRGEPDLDPALVRLREAVGDPRGRQVAVERRQRPGLRELELSGDRRRPQVSGSPQQRDGLGVLPGSGNGSIIAALVAQRVARAERGAAILLG